MTARYKGCLAPDFHTAISLTFGARRCTAWPTATAHDNARVIEVNLLGKLRIHTTNRHGINLGAEHDIPGNRCIYGSHMLQDFYCLHRACIVTAHFSGQSEAEKPFVNQLGDNPVGKLFQFLRFIACF